MIEHILRASLERNITITIIYAAGNGISKRNIKVLEMNSDNTKAYCYLRNQIRIFKLNNILSASWCTSSKKAV